MKDFFLIVSERTTSIEKGKKRKNKGKYKERKRKEEKIFFFQSRNIKKHVSNGRKIK